MFVWLHTSSPPQHIAQEPFAGCVDRLPSTLAAINARRGLSCKVAMLGHHERLGEDQLHIFDNVARYRAWVDRNAATFEEIHTIGG